MESPWAARPPSLSLDTDEPCVVPRGSLPLLPRRITGGLCEGPLCPSLARQETQGLAEALESRALRHSGPAVFSLEQLLKPQTARLRRKLGHLGLRHFTDVELQAQSLGPIRGDIRTWAGGSGPPSPGDTFCWTSAAAGVSLGRAPLILLENSEK